MASDNKLRCAVIYRLEGPGPTAVPLCKLDYAANVESHTAEGMYGGKKADFAKAVARVISNDPPTGISKGTKCGGFKVVQADVHQVVYGADSDNICYCVITGLGYSNRVAMKFLEELAEEFMKTIGLETAQKAKENSLNVKAKKVLQAMCKKFETPESGGDKAHKVLGAVDKVKGQMASNISGMLKNQESAESLNEKSAQLNEQAGVFKKNAKVLKQKMWYQNMKMWLALICVILIAGILILLPIFLNLKGVWDTGAAVASVGGDKSGGMGSGDDDYDP